MSTCEECGFEGTNVAAATVGEALQALVRRYRDALTGAGETAARRRPGPDVWSALEYASHVRDVLLAQRDRMVLAMVKDGPGFARMHRDERPELCDYGAFPVPVVLDQLEMAASLCAVALRAINGPAWQRTFVYNWPEPAEHDLVWLARHTLHEAVHHVLDVERVLARVGPDAGGGGRGGGAGGGGGGTAGALSLVTLVVEDYDRAIEFFTGVLGFDLVEDSPSNGDSRPKRWVVVRPPGAETGLLLARADGPEQRAVIGRQVAGRVGFFLRVPDAVEAHRRLLAAGAAVEGPLRDETYGKVTVFLDLAGNRWDLIGPPADAATLAETAGPM